MVFGRKDKEEAGHQHTSMDFSSTDDVLSEVEAIRALLPSSDREETRALVAKLNNLSGKLPRDEGADRKGRRAAGVVSAVIAQAQQQLNQQNGEDSTRHASMLLSSTMQSTIYFSMSAAQKLFYDKIDAKKDYVLPAVTESGAVAVPEETKAVSGEELKKRFSILQYHSLSEDEKKKMLDKTFGLDTPEENARKSPAQLKTELEELDYLKQALKDMEAYKGYQLIMRGGDMRGALGQIAHNRSVFAKAQGQVEQLQAAYAALIEQPDNAARMAAVADIRRAMKKTLKEEVIDDLLTGVGSASNQGLGAPAVFSLPSLGSIFPGVAPLVGLARGIGATR